MCHAAFCRPQARRAALDAAEGMRIFVSALRLELWVTARAMLALQNPSRRGLARLGTARRGVGQRRAGRERRRAAPDRRAQA